MREKKTYLVTGADRGIGEALCLAVQARGDHAIAACLGDSERLRAAGARVEKGIDVTSDEAVASLGERLASVPIDVVVNVAGIVLLGDFPRLSARDLMREYDVNALGPLRVVQAVLPSLSEGSKIGIVTSRVGSLGENLSGGLHGYRMSKAAANMLGICLAHDLRSRGIAVVLLHPGTVRTEMTRGLPTGVAAAGVEPEEAARGLLARLDELTIETTGTFRHANGEALPW